VCEALGTHMTLRTAWIYDAHGQDLVKAILRLAGGHPRLRVVADRLADGNARWGQISLLSGAARSLGTGAPRFVRGSPNPMGSPRFRGAKPFAAVIAELRREEIVARLQSRRCSLPH
jgi:hypothetical protein